AIPIDRGIDPPNGRAAGVAIVGAVGIAAVIAVARNERVRTAPQIMCALERNQSITVKTAGVVSENSSHRLGARRRICLVAAGSESFYGAVGPTHARSIQGRIHREAYLTGGGPKIGWSLAGIC